MQYIVGWPFLTDGISVLCTGATNPNYLTDWFLSRKLVTGSQTSSTVEITLAVPAPIRYVALTGVIPPAASLNPVWRILVYSNIVLPPILDTGDMPVVVPTTALSGVSTTEPFQLIHVWTEKSPGGVIKTAGTSIGRRIRIILKTDSAAVWRLGYVASGDATVLGGIVGAGFDPSTTYSGRSSQSTGGMVTDGRVSSITTCPISLAAASTTDVELLRAVFENVADSRPFFLYPSDPPVSRASQLGIVRFASPRLNVQQRGGNMLGLRPFSVSAEITAWR